MSTNFFGDVYSYDILNISVSHELTMQITSLDSSQEDMTFTIKQVQISTPQVDQNNCGFLP